MELTDQRKKAHVIVRIVHVILLKLTWLDLRRRPDAAVRKKEVRRFVSGVNATGSVAYSLCGRRRVSPGDIGLGASG